MKVKYDTEVNMRIRYSVFFSISVLLIIFISLMSSGGCDLCFGGDCGSSNGGSQSETLEGSVVSVIPERSIEGITVDVINENDFIFSSITGPNGFFRIPEFDIEIANFAGPSIRVDFLDEELEPPELLGTTRVNIFPGAKVELGNIRLDSGSVFFDNPKIVTFDGRLQEKNCTSLNTGTMDIETLTGKVCVLTNIVTQTDLVDDRGNTLTCEQYLVGIKVNVRGILQTGDVVEAIQITRK